MRQFENKSFLFGASGVLSVALGITLMIVGKNAFGGAAMQNSGVVLSALGAVLLIFAMHGFRQISRRYQATQHGNHSEQEDDMIAQIAGNRSIFDVFCSADNGRAFSFYCNNTCILKDGAGIRRGRIEPTSWEEGNPTQWRVTMDSESGEESCEISRIDSNILIRSEHGEEVFYRR